MKYLSANVIIPVEGEPCFNSVLGIDNEGTIEGIYDKSGLGVPHSEIVHYEGILCPGFVNTHCHLELSWAKGVISESEGLDRFIWQLQKFRKSISESYILKAIEKSAFEMEQAGIVATADIVNDNSTLNYKSSSKHYFHNFVEFYASNPANASAIFEKAVQLKSEFEDVPLSGSASIVPHATYSLSEELFRLYAKTRNESLSSIHHQENEDENLFFKDGSGAIAARRKAFNPDLAIFNGTGKRPMESIAAYFDPDRKLLLVHNTVTQQQDIDFVYQYFNKSFWCLCPNANLFIENRLPAIDLFRKNNCRITLGTDSLASNHQLSILEEIKTIQKHFPHIPITELIRWGTLNGAEFLNLEQKLGSFVKGKRPGVVLIENAELQTLQLTPKTTSKLIIPAHI